MMSEASRSVLSSPAPPSASLKQEERIAEQALVATAQGSVVGNAATATLDSGRRLKDAKDGQEHYSEEEEEEEGELEQDDQGYDPDDVHLAGQKPERRPWSRREDDAITRLVGDDTYNSSIYIILVV